MKLFEATCRILKIDNNVIEKIISYKKDELNSIRILYYQLGIYCPGEPKKINIIPVKALDMEDLITQTSPYLFRAAEFISYDYIEDSVKYKFLDSDDDFCIKNIDHVYFGNLLKFSLEEWNKDYFNKFAKKVSLSFMGGEKIESTFKIYNSSSDFIHFIDSCGRKLKTSSAEWLESKVIEKF